MNVTWPGNFYVVATPIGNLEDMAPRALRALREADLVAAEDTRHSGHLLAHFEIRKPLVSYHQFSEAKRTAEFRRLFELGKSIALISDAGLPGVSDPGERLIRAAVEMPACRLKSCRDPPRRCWPWPGPGCRWCRFISAAFCR